MKKLNLLMAGLLLLGVSANAQERLYFNDFEDQGSQFVDSIAQDTIFKIEYYSCGKVSNGTHSNDDVLGWDIVFSKDTLEPLYNAVQPLGSRGDTWTVEYDKSGAESEEIEALGGAPGQYYFKYVSGGEAGGSDCNNYEANLFVRGIKVQENSSYRVTYYVKASKDAKIDTELMRGYYNSEKPFSMKSTSGSGEHTSVVTIPNKQADIWQRVTYMTYYTTDSIAELYMHASGYWWCDAWLATDPETGNQYNEIKQFDTYFLRFSFMQPAKTYMIDDIEVYNSWIGGAEYNGNIIRINFGYQTNLATLVKNYGSTIVLDGKWIHVSGYDKFIGDKFDIDVESCEYHDDGYMYIFLYDDCVNYDDIRIDFTNPDEEYIQLKYTGSLYPKANDTEWVGAGKIVPNFQNEFVLPNPSVSATPWAEVAPTVVATSPDEGSFNLDLNTNNVYTVTFNKEVYVDETGATGVMAKILGAGVDEYLEFVSYDEATFTVTFQLPGTIAKLDGDYEVLILNAKAQEESDAAPEFVINVSYGAATAEEPVTFLKVNFDDYANGSIPPGFSTKFSGGAENSTNGSACRIKQFMEGSEYRNVFYLSSRTGGGKTAGTFGQLFYGAGAVEDDPVLHLEPGEYYVTFAACGWDANSGDLAFTAYAADDEDMEPVGEYYHDVYAVYGVDVNSDQMEAAPVVGFTTAKVLLTITREADYILEWKTEYGYYAGVAIADIMVTNKYSFAYASLKSFNDAYTAALTMQANANAQAEKYAGSDLDTFAALIKKYDGFTHTSPKKYEEVVAELKAGTADMQKRMSLVDKFFLDLAAAEAIVTENAEADEAGLAAYKALVEVYNDNKYLSCPTKTYAELDSINKALEAATKAYNDRIANMGTFDKNIANCEDVFAQVGYSGLDEYKATQAAYNEYKDLDLINCTDEELKAANDALKAAVDSFNNKLTMAKTLTARINSLKDLADSVSVNFGEMADAIAAQTASNLEDDDNLAAIYKLGIQAKMNADLAAGKSFDGLDMTGFIKNSNLYTMATDQVVKNSADPLPGWTVSNILGNVYFGLPWSNQAASASTPVKNSWLGLDWNSGLTMTQKIEELPAGKYTLQCGFENDAPKGNLIINQYNADGSILSVDTLAWTAAAEKMGEANLNQSFEIEVKGILEIVAVANTNHWGGFDKWALTFDAPIAGFAYADAAAAAEAALAEKLAGVDVTKAINTIEYYNLNGVRIATPQKGINIRVITTENGMRSIEKILVK